MIVLTTIRTDEGVTVQDRKVNCGVLVLNQDASQVVSSCNFNHKQIEEKFDTDETGMYHNLMRVVVSDESRIVYLTCPGDWMHKSLDLMTNKIVHED